MGQIDPTDLKVDNNHGNCEQESPAADNNQSTAGQQEVEGTCRHG